MNSKNQKIFLTGFFLVSIFFATHRTVMAAEKFPAYPMAFYGQAKIDGVGLMAGSKVIAVQNGTILGEVKIEEAGFYGSANPLKSRLLVREFVGELEFKYTVPDSSDLIGGNPSIIYSHSFAPGATVEFDLSFVSTGNNPPSNGGSGGGGSSGGGGGGTASGGSSGSGSSGSVPNPAVQIVNDSSSDASTTLIKEIEPIIIDSAEKESRESNENVVVLGVQKDYRMIQSENIQEEAGIIFTGDLNFILKNSSRKRDQKLETRNFARQLPYGTKGLSSGEKYKLQHFISYGTKTTQSLGEGERAGVVNSFHDAFGKYPVTQSEWQDAIRIANGRWPEKFDPKAEKYAMDIFAKLYKRKANSSAKNDDAALKIIAYGLRPEKRNLKSEAAAKNIFKRIFKKNPAQPGEWDIVRAIAYSGAKR